MTSAYHLGPRARDLKRCVTNKIRMLEEEFWLDLSFDEIDHFRQLTTKTEVDQYAHDLLRKKL